MAHGFLSPTDSRGTSGLEKFLDRKFEEQFDKQTRRLGNFLNDKFNDLLFNLRTKERSPKPYSWSKEDEGTPLQKMIGGSAFQRALPGVSDAVDATPFGGELAKTTGIVRLRPVDDPIIDVEATAVDDNFFPTSSKLLPDGDGVGGDSGEVIRVLEEQTQVITSLVQATDDQTKTQQQIANTQQQQAEKLARKSVAASEAAGFTQDDFSGNDKYLRLASNVMRGRGTGGGLGGGLGLLSSGLGGKVGARKMLTNSIMRRGASRAGKRMGIALGGKLGMGLGKKLGRKLGGKAIGKIAGKGIAKSLGKKIPLVGLGLGAIFAAQRAMQGDFLGAGLELASGAASTVPGVGTAASVGIDAALMAKDMTAMKDGGITDGPVNALIGEEGKEAVFPLEGSQGKKTFVMFGEGILEAQRRKKGIFGKVQAEGLKEYYDKQGGWMNMGAAFSSSFTFNTNIFDGFGKTLKEILGALELPGIGKLFNFGKNGDDKGDTPNTNYGEKMDGFFSKRNSGAQMQVNADGVFTSQIGGVVTKVGEHDKLGKYVDIVNEERGVTERIADISEVMPGIEVGASIGPGDPVAKGNDAGIVHYEIRNGGNANPEKYKAKFGHGGTQDPTKFLEGINSNESLNNTLINSNGNESNDLNASSSEVALAGEANKSTVINNIVSSDGNNGGSGSTVVSNQIPIGSSMGDMGGYDLSNMRLKTLVG